MEKAQRFGQAADEVCGMHAIEAAERCREIHRIAVVEADAACVSVLWSLGDEFCGELCFFKTLVWDFFSMAECFGGVDE